MEKMYPPKVSVIGYRNKGSESMATVTMEILGAEINDINVAMHFSAGIIIIISMKIIVKFHFRRYYELS